MLAARKRGDFEAEKLPYRQGFLLALNWNTRISDATEGRRTLDDAMRELLREARSNKSPLTASEIATAIERVGGGDVSREINGVMNRGILVELAPGALPGCATKTTEYLASFDPGFDLDSLGRSKVITGVRSNSAAYMAGLRDGQKVFGIDITRDPNVMSKLEVEDRSGRRKIEFYPAAPVSTPIPQLAIVPRFSDRPQDCPRRFTARPIKEPCLSHSR